MPQPDGGRVLVYVLYQNNKPVDHHVNLEIVKGWYEFRVQGLQNPVKVLEVGMWAVGGLYVREVAK